MSVVIAISGALIFKSIKEVNEPIPSRYPVDNVRKVVKRVTGENPVVFKVLYVNLDNETYIFEGDSQPGVVARPPFVVWDGNDSKGLHVTGVGRDLVFLQKQWDRLGLVFR